MAEAPLPRPIDLDPVYQAALDDVINTPSLHSSWQVIAEYPEPVQAYNARGWLTKKYDDRFDFTCKRDGDKTMLAVKYDPE